MKKICKFIISAIAAILIWNIIISIFIYKNDGLSRDLDMGPRYKPNTVIVNGTEGYGNNKFDNLGFNNEYIDLNKHDKRIIVLGDSHTEATQVNRSQNFCSILQSKMKNNYEVLNLGISGNSVAEYIYYADKYLKIFNPDYVIIQVTGDDFFSDATNSSKRLYIKNDNVNSIEILENKDVVINKTKLFKDKYLNFPIITYMYNFKINQLKNSLLYPNQNNQTNEKVVADEESLNYEKNRILVNWEINKLKELYGSKLIILYLPSTPNIIDNQVEYVNKNELKSKKLIEEYSVLEKIPSIDLNDEFINLYKQYGIFPRGFNNTTPGNGHLNQYGHEVVAEKVYKYFNDIMK